MKKIIILSLLSVNFFNIYTAKNNNQNVDSEPFMFHDNGVGIIFDDNDEPVSYDDGGELEYDDDDNIIIYDNETDEALGYIIQNKDGEYEFHDYDENNDIISNTVQAGKSAISGYKKLVKKLWGFVVWSKKKKEEKSQITTPVKAKPVKRTKKIVVEPMYIENR